MNHQAAARGPQPLFCIARADVSAEPGQLQGIGTAYKSPGAQDMRCMYAQGDKPLTFCLELVLYGLSHCRRTSHCCHSHSKQHMRLHMQVLDVFTLPHTPEWGRHSIALTLTRTALCRGRALDTFTPGNRALDTLMQAPAICMGQALAAPTLHFHAGRWQAVGTSSPACTGSGTQAFTSRSLHGTGTGCPAWPAPWCTLPARWSACC